jgi:hypothetical protein
MKTLPTIFMTTALALGTIATMDVPASADYFGNEGGFYGVPGGYPDLSYIFHPFAAHPHRHYADPYGYRTYEHTGGGHVQRCLARYRTYVPATDLYFKHPGVQARCRL